MGNKTIWVSSAHISGNEMDYIKLALNENLLTSFGSNISGFESELETYIGCNKKISLVNSGTSALHLGLILLGVQKDDEVICQSFTYCASAFPVLYQGAVPVFIDSERETWNLCPEQLEHAIKDRIANGKKPKAIIAVHSFGMPYKHEEIQYLSEKYQIPVLEDAAEALGSRYKDLKCGTLGNMAVFSFNGNKIITTSAGGGLIVANQNLKERADSLASHAKHKEPHYHHTELGYNYKMSNVAAGIGRAQFESLEARITKRRANFEYYKKNIKKEGVQFVNEPEGFFSNRWLSCILTESFEMREKIRLNLQDENIETRPLWKPMHLQPVFEKYPHYTNGVSEDLFEKGLCLPSGSDLTNEDLNRVIESI